MRLDLSHYLPKFAIDVPIRSPHRWPRRTTLAWIAGVGLASLAAIVALLPTLMSARYRAAGEAALASDAASATIAFQQALRWFPNNPEIHRALAQSYLRLNQPQEAIDMLEQAYRLQPASLLIRQELAQAYEASGQLERADGMWAALGLSAPSLLQLGEQARAKKQIHEALLWYERARRVAPDAGDSHYFAGLAYRDTKQFDLAIQQWLKASQLSPNNRDIWYELGQAYSARKEWGLALHAYKQGLKGDLGRIGPSALYYQLGYLLQHEIEPHDLVGAWEFYQQAITLNDFANQGALLADAYYQRGNLLTAQQRWDAASQEYRLAIQIRPKHYWAHITLADALWHLGQRDAAYETAYAAITLAPDAKYAYRLVGNFYRFEGKVEDAREMFTKVITLDPRDQAARDVLETLR
jgi:tetratricopeptide (TPR) repeat protein